VRNNELAYDDDQFAYVGEFARKRRRVGVAEFARRRVDWIPLLQYTGILEDNFSMIVNQLQALNCL